MKKLMGRRDVEDALSRLDKLTREEFQTEIAQILKVTHDVGEEVKDVGKKVDGVDVKLDGVDIKVGGVDVKVDGVSVQVTDIGDKVNVAVEGTFK